MNREVHALAACSDMELCPQGTRPAGPDRTCTPAEASSGGYWTPTGQPWRMGLRKKVTPTWGQDGDGRIKKAPPATMRPGISTATSHRWFAWSSLLPVVWLVADLPPERLAWIVFFLQGLLCEGGGK